VNKSGQLQRASLFNFQRTKFIKEQIMENLPLVSWHARELLKLLEQDPNNTLTGRLATELQGVLNSPLLNQIAPVEFLISKEAVDAANRAEQRRKEAFGS
jgi:hypothetical protein